MSDHRITQVPNYVLNSLFVDNFTRAHAMHELLTIPANFDTTFSDIQTLRDDLERFVRDKENRRDFKPDIDVEVAGLGNMDRLELRVDIRHKSNWSNESVRAARRSKFMCALVLALRRINIRAPAPPANESGGPTNLTPCSDDTIANNLLDSRHPQPPVNRALTVRRSLASNDHHLNPHSPVEDEETRYQTPSGSPRKRLSSNLNPGMQSASRQSSTGRRKVSSAEGLGLANGVPIITEPVPVQRPAHQMSYNPYESGARTRQQRRFSYDVDHAGNANGNGNETPGSDEKRG